MGLFTHIIGMFHCLRCSAESEARIQTKLFKVDGRNSAKDYCVGDSEEIELSRIDDYEPLHHWNSTDDLVVVMGDWSCSHCLLGWSLRR